jgi:hypothetical protein
MAPACFAVDQSLMQIVDLALGAIAHANWMQKSTPRPMKSTASHRDQVERAHQSQPDRKGNERPPPG